MSFVVKKRDLSDPAQLQTLIVEHADDLERGLTILDTRLLLGQATIDVVGLDAAGALVLIAVGLIADEEMFLKAVEGYSWCLEYPESIRRLYPAARISTAQPPRVMFVVERMPDAFHRKIKQLGIREVDCVEFRHLDVDGTAAVYFDSLARLRRDMSPTPPAAEPVPAPTGPVAKGRPTSSVKLQRLLGADRPAAGREPAPIVRMVHRATPRPEPKPLAGAPRAERPVAANKRHVDPPLAVKQFVPEPVPATAMPTAEADIVATVVAEETLTAGPDLLAQNLEAVDTMVEPFAIVMPAATNGHAAATTTAETPRVVFEPPSVVPEPALATPEPPTPTDEPVLVAPEALVIAAPMLVIAEPAPVVLEETPVVAEPTLVIPEPTLALDEPERAIEVPSLELEPATHESDHTVPEPELAEVVPDVVDLPPTPEIATESLTLTIDDSPVALTSVPELESVAISAPEPELVVPSVPELEPVHLVEETPEPPAPVIAVAEPVVVEPEPVVPALTLEPVAPVTPPAPPAPAPSVFSRRPAEAGAARTEPKVSFAGAAKDLLAKPNRAPEAEPPVSAPRASVEEITRAAIDDLVGAPATTKPSGPFAKAPTQKRPRTIAPPPSDGQPIAGGPKLGTAAKRLGTPASASEPAAPRVAEGESTQQVPQGFEGLQFPNDGVLTRQWMEFLNQMAAGK